MSNVVINSLAKSHYIQLIIKWRSLVKRCSYIRLSFLLSKINGPDEYWAMKEKGEEILVKGNDVPIQKVSVSGNEPWTIWLWYIPHIAEVALESHTQTMENLASASRPMKIDGFYVKNFAVSTTFMNLVQMMQDVAAMSFGMDKEANVSMRKLKEIDFIVNAISHTKKEFMSIGNDLEYSKIEDFMNQTQKFWNFRIKSILMEFMYASAAQNRLSDLFAFQNFLKFPSMVMNDNEMIYSLKLSEILHTIDSNGQQLILNVSNRANADIDDFSQGSSVDSLLSSMRLKLNYLMNGSVLTTLRMYLISFLFKRFFIKNEEEISVFKAHYRTEILTKVVKKHFGNDNHRIKESLLEHAVEPGKSHGSSLDYKAKMALDATQIEFLKEDISNLITKPVLIEAKAVLVALKDERTGRLFQNQRSVIINSPLGGSNNNISVLKDEYTYKSQVFDAFKFKMHEASVSGVNEAYESQTTDLLDFIKNHNIMIIKKDDFNEAMIDLGAGISSIASSRVSEMAAFNKGQDQKIQALFLEKDRTIAELKRKNEQLQSDLKLMSDVAGMKFSTDLALDTAALSIELCDIRQAKKAEERKLRQEVVEEYESLVKDLVQEIQVLSGRFNEFRTNTVKQVTEIMTESKREELIKVADREEFSGEFKERLLADIEHENETKALRDENHELKMTLIKIRSMYLMKETALRSALEKKMKRIAENNRRAENKLWNSYRESEAREKVLKKQLNKTQKALATSELEIEKLKISHTKATEINRTKQVSEAEVQRLHAEIEKYKRLNIEGMEKELREKTALVKQLLGDQERMKMQFNTKRKDSLAVDQKTTILKTDLLKAKKAEKEANDEELAKLAGNKRFIPLSATRPVTSHTSRIAAIQKETVARPSSTPKKQ